MKTKMSVNVNENMCETIKHISNAWEMSTSETLRVLLKKSLLHMELDQASEEGDVEHQKRVRGALYGY